VLDAGAALPAPAACPRAADAGGAYSHQHLFVAALETPSGKLQVGAGQSPAHFKNIEVTGGQGGWIEIDPHLSGSTADHGGHRGIFNRLQAVNHFLGHPSQLVV